MPPQPPASARFPGAGGMLVGFAKKSAKVSIGQHPVGIGSTYGQLPAFRLAARERLDSAVRR